VGGIGIRSEVFPIRIQIHELPPPSTIYMQVVNILIHPSIPPSHCVAAPPIHSSDGGRCAVRPKPPRRHLRPKPHARMGVNAVIFPLVVKNPRHRWPSQQQACSRRRRQRGHPAGGVGSLSRGGGVRHLPAGLRCRGVAESDAMLARLPQPLRISKWLCHSVACPLCRHQLPATPPEPEEDEEGGRRRHGMGGRRHGEQLSLPAHSPEKKRGREVNVVI
jgi:hypothetical protein